MVASASDPAEFEDERWVTAGEVRMLRRRAGLDQGQLAELVGVAQKTISNWENGKSEPTASQYRRIAEKCGRIIHLNRRRLELVA